MFYSHARIRTGSSHCDKETLRNDVQDNLEICPKDEVQKMFLIFILKSGVRLQDVTANEILYMYSYARMPFEVNIYYEIMGRQGTDKKTHTRAQT